MTEKTEIKNIIEENCRRLKKNSAVYNPVTGEGSTSIERKWVEIEGFPLTRMNLPIPMLHDNHINELIEKGAQGFLSSRGNKMPSHKNIITLWR